MSVHQVGATWNGSTWVQSSPAKTGQVYSSYSYTNQNSNYLAYSQQPAASSFQGQPTAVAGGSPMPQPTSNHVEYYSRYYQYWTEQSKLKKKEAAVLPPGPSKDEALRTVAWADYYATQSAQYAHYYNNEKKKAPSAAMASKQTLPPPPPSALNLPTPPSTSKPSQTKNKNINTLDKYERTEKSHKFSQSSPSLSNSSPKTEHKPSSKTYETATVLQDPEAARNSKRMNLYSKDIGVDNNQKIASSSLLEKKTYLEMLQGTSKKRNAGKIDAVFNSGIKRSRVSKSEVTEEVYMKRMPTNDSYYGRGSSSPSASSVESPSMKPSKKQKKSSIHTIAKTSKKVSSKKVNNGFESSKKILERRANRFSGKGGLDNSSDDFTSQVAPTTKLGQYMGMSVIGGGGGHGKKSLKRSNTFSHGYSGSSTADKEKDYEKMTVRGTCQRLEKEFFRLTAPPQANMVRPQPILQQHLKNLKQQWVEKENDYTWLCSQLKALRQDLTVQRINNQFAVDVYETHARIALEQGDLNEYNQCQTQLKELYDVIENKYSKKIAKGMAKVSGLSNQNEFIAYRIIYYVFLTGNKKYDGGSSDLFNIMLSLTSSQKTDPCIVHALKVRVAVAENDYHSFFRLHDECPMMGAYLMDNMVPSMRFSALNTICKAYRPSISVKFVLSVLGFDMENEQDLQLGLKWIRSCGGKLDDSQNRLITKDSVVRYSTTKDKSSLI